MEPIISPMKNFVVSAIATAIIVTMLYLGRRNSDTRRYGNGNVGVYAAGHHRGTMKGWRNNYEINH